MRLVGTNAVGEVSPILDAMGVPVTAGRITPATISHSYTHDPENPTERSFARYAAWRETKCKPRDYDHPAERIEDIDQATHEFVGEVAELAELVVLHGSELLTDAALRAKLVGEIGDIFFTGFWVLDGWRANVLRHPEAPAPDAVLDAEELAQAYEISARVADATPLDGEERSALGMCLTSLAFQSLASAGLLCNSFKKQRWQMRPQDPKVQAARVLQVLTLCVHVLAFVGASPVDALANNVEKLDARYPSGYQHNVGGGLRTGKGA